MGLSISLLGQVSLAGACSARVNSDPAQVLQRSLRTINPQLISFGELHWDCASNSSPTLKMFAVDLLPILANYGVTDLVLEHLTQDQAVEDELNLFYSTPGLMINANTTPRLFSFCRLCSFSGLQDLLNKAKMLGIRVHAGGPSTSDLNRSDIIAEGKSAGLRPLTVRLYGDRLDDKVAPLIAKGRKVATYSGIRHNDVDRTTAQGSLGRKYDRLLNHRYLEIDLIDRNRLQNLLSNLPPAVADYLFRLRQYQSSANPTFNSCNRRLYNQYFLVTN
ncbi:MAG: hypothetical protein WCW67_06040 [Candidatus Margulisiibacteriota bacterium]|jgi:hypothetical protein